MAAWQQEGETAPAGAAWLINDIVTTCHVLEVDVDALAVEPFLHGARIHCFSTFATAWDHLLPLRGMQTTFTFY